MILNVALTLLFVTVGGEKWEKKSHGVPAELAPFLIKTAKRNSILECGSECEQKSCELMHYIVESGNCSIYSVYMADESIGHNVYAQRGATDRRRCFTDAIKIFTGKLSVTSSNKTCQRWDSQYPHPHPYTQPDMFPDGTVSDAHNYCRDPSGSGYLWCYTTDPEGSGEPCAVYKYTSEENPAVRTNRYTGTLRVSGSNKTCLWWDEHPSYVYTFPDATVYDAHNYCRDPDNIGALWCFVDDPESTWDLCDTYRCSSEGCLTLETHLYTGTLSAGVNKLPCQRWDSQHPRPHPFYEVDMFPDDTVHDAHNYCRDPNFSGVLWCLSTSADPDSGNAVLCDIYSACSSQ